MPRDPLVLPVPQRPDYEATYAQLSEVGATLGDSYNIGNAAYDGVADHDVVLDAHGNRLNGLEGRTDLLEGVVAYGNLSATRNEWCSPLNGYRPALQFGQQVGPMKGVGNMGNGAMLYSKGLWRVDCWVMGDHTTWGGDGWIAMDIEVRNSNNTLYEQKTFEFDAPGRGSVGGCHSFVTPAPNYRIHAFVRSGRWRRFLGGTLYSTMSVNKWDNNTTNQAPGTVGDGPGAAT